MLTVIVAVDAKGGIGIDNHLPWHLPEDLAHFRRTTLGHPVIMGRKTFDSLGRPLPGRRNLVLTRQKDWSCDCVEVVHSMDEAITRTRGAAAFLIGGGELFAEAIGVADRAVVTHIDKVYPCDAFFPIEALTLWTEISRERHHSESGDLTFSIVTYRRGGEDQ